MRIEWLRKKESDRVIIFFNGWGMDPGVVAHLEGEVDVVVCGDYRHLNAEVFPELDHYRKIYVVAWSMGVWAAANTLPVFHVKPERLIALNGTERPIDDKYGIPERVYLLTEKGMNEKGREKFISRMLNGADERMRFAGCFPQRLYVEVCEELVEIRIHSTGYQNELKWDKIYISEKDVIFPVTAQQNWWQGKGVEIHYLSGGHYPFYQFRRWEEIIEI